MRHLITLFSCALLLAHGSVSADAFKAGAQPHPDWNNSLRPTGQASAPMEVVAGGVARYQILLPEEPTTQDQKAAADLVKWVREITGAELPIVSESAAFQPTGREISLGRTQFLKASDVPAANEDLGDEGYGIAVAGETLFLFGGRLRGPIYAVYSLLEEDLGARWYAPDATVLPSTPDLSISPVPRTFVPPLKRRDPYYSDVWDAEWFLHNRAQSHRIALPAQWGGHHSFPGFFVHTFNLLMPPDEFFDQHPEYYAEIDGSRQPSQLCMTNSEVLRIVTERVLEQLRQHPDSRYVDVSPNDWRLYCDCADCTEIREREGGYAGPLIHFVNQVADAVAQEFPDVSVTTLAYLGTYEPPKHLRPRDNVQIVLASDAHAWEFPFLHVWETEKFNSALEAWSKTGADIMIWDYPHTFPNYMLPWPNVRLVSENLFHFVKHGVQGVLEQATHSTSNGIDRSYMRAWVLAKQLWDPSRTDTEALIRDFHLGYFGKAAEPMIAWDQMLHQRWEKAHGEWKELHGGNLNPSPEVAGQFWQSRVLDYGPKFVAEAEKLFDQAEELAADNPVLLHRVQRWRLPLMYVKAELGPAGEPLEYLKLLNKFERMAFEEDVRVVKEGTGAPDLHRELHFWRSLAQVPPEGIHWQELSSEWKFSPDPDEEGISREWHSPGFDDSSWGTVRSDLGHRGWESQGYSDYETGYGWYRQTFDLPAHPDEMPNLRLFFGGVDEQAEVWINGQLALSHTAETTGMSKDFLWNRPFMFDPTRWLKPGETNTLAVRVHNALHVGGIYRPVRLVWGTPFEDLRTLDQYMSRMDRLKDLTRRGM